MWNVCPMPRRRGALDVAMIGLMRDARLRVSEAVGLTWGDLERVPGSSGRVRVSDNNYRVVSADTLRLLSSVHRDGLEPPVGLADRTIIMLANLLGL